MELIVTSAPEREDLFVEVYDESERLCAFVERSGNGSLSIRIVNERVEPMWTFDLNAVLDILERAQRRLGGSRTAPTK